MSIETHPRLRVDLTRDLCLALASTMQQSYWPRDKRAPSPSAVIFRRRNVELEPLAYPQRLTQRALIVVAVEVCVLLIEIVPTPRSGFLGEINARVVGETVMLLGAGRTKKGDPIDHAVGAVVHHKVGDYVEVGEPLVTVHANQEELLIEARRRLIEAHIFREEKTERLPLFYGIVKSQ